MYEILTSDQMKTAESLTIEAGTPSFQLMTAAGHGVAAAMIAQFKPCPVLVLCGSGSNGGDGFIAAAQLQAAGWNVRVACLVKTAALKGDAAQAAKLWTGAVEPLNSNIAPRDCALVVDAVFGTGFHGALDPELVTCFDKLRARKPAVVAVDLPSGTDANTGAVAEGTLHANVTVTFARKKIAHVLQSARNACGRIIVAHIGIDDKNIALTGTQLFENAPALWLAQYPVPRTDMHKYDRGHVVVYGGPQRTGAACLAAGAAQKIGAGAVTIASPAQAQAVYSLYRASIMVDTYSDTEDWRGLLRDERKNTIVIGPGGGEGTRDATLAALSFHKTCVLDADVFSAFKSQPEELFQKLSPHHVLTPHEGEFARLFPAIAESGADKISRTRAAAKKANTMIVLKGSDTVIAAPDGTAVINTNAPPQLATAGSGDVLSGMIAGLSSQGMPPFQAACAAVWLHGETARSYGFGLTPEDIIININHTLNNIFGIT